MKIFDLDIFNIVLLNKVEIYLIYALRYLYKDDPKVVVFTGDLFDLMCSSRAYIYKSLDSLIEQGYIKEWSIIKQRFNIILV